MRYLKRMFWVVIFGVMLSGGMTVQAAEPAGEPIVIPNVIELSGAGAVVAEAWKDGALMAAAEINSSGGILGRPVKLTFYDTQSVPGVARSQMLKVVGMDPYVIMGPIYSSSTRVAMLVSQKAHIPTIVGSEAAIITEMGNPYIFRTGSGADVRMENLGRYMIETLGADEVAMIWSNTAYGKGIRDSLAQYLKEHGVEIVADVSAEVGQLGFSSAVARVSSSDADLLFVGLLQESSARFLKQAQKAGLDMPMIGGTTLADPKVIELAKEAANGVKGIVGLAPSIPNENIQQFVDKFEKQYGYTPPHDAMKGYLALYAIKQISKRMGELNSERFAEVMHGATISSKQEPGILTTTAWDENGEVYRKSYIIEVVSGKQKVVDTVPLPPILADDTGKS